MPRTDIDAVISSCDVRCSHLANRKKGSGYWLTTPLGEPMSNRFYAAACWRGWLPQCPGASYFSLVCVGHSADPVGSWTTLPTALSMCCNCVTNSDVSLR